MSALIQVHKRNMPYCKKELTSQKYSHPPFFVKQHKVEIKRKLGGFDLFVPHSDDRPLEKEGKGDSTSH